jgi:hypothetical protein
MAGWQPSVISFTIAWLVSLISVDSRRIRIDRGSLSTLVGLCLGLGNQALDDVSDHSQLTIIGDHLHTILNYRMFPNYSATSLQSGISTDCG